MSKKSRVGWSGFFIFFLSAKPEIVVSGIRGYIAPPKMKVKGYMYPQMKKSVGILSY
jgi:hypothetical protein